jgi:hypothetical protein
MSKSRCERSRADNLQTGLSQELRTRLDDAVQLRPDSLEWCQCQHRYRSHLRALACATSMYTLALTVGACGTRHNLPQEREEDVNARASSKAHTTRAECAARIADDLDASASFSRVP